MKLEIRLFATLRDKAGQDRILITLAEPATVADVVAATAAAYPRLAEALGSSIVSVNKAFAGEDTAVHPGDEIAIFPPVSGGGNRPWPTYFAITTAELDLNEIHRRLVQPDVGAVVSFTGSVRGQTRRDGLPPETIYLEYEAYA
ncbi:MAG TPA: molybdopterin converting factor, partial [Anaerolineae bacterium]|nr:molybdopterin converting factor [Anaerolineae bacterium]